jgi:fructoselysine-6-P-deglycase FrlB-like protein
VNPDLLLADLERKPEALRDLATSLSLEDPWAPTDITARTRLVLLGMGSSHYANGVAAARLRSHGVDAVAELASSDLLPAPREGTIVVAVSASGGSTETLDAVDQYVGRCPVVAVTNVDDSPLVERAGSVVRMAAGPEVSGVACRSYQHTLALWLALEGRLVGRPDVAAVVASAAVASADLLARRDAWLPGFVDLSVGPDGTHFVAPARRLGSAQQAALMLRETPRLPAVGCETGDWSHVDVYLTKSTDYRLVLFAGSRWEPALLTWVRERNSTLVAVGGEVADAALEIRYAGDDVDDVRLLSEVLVAELAAASLWSLSPRS